MPAARPSVADVLARPAHAGGLAGAPLLGAATAEDALLVRIALWRDDAGRVTRARWQATTCATLVAYAELACSLLEAGHDPGHLDGDALRAALAGVHPGRRDRADLVARAIRAALEPRPERSSPSTSPTSSRPATPPTSSTR